MTDKTCTTCVFNKSWSCFRFPPVPVQVKTFDVRSINPGVFKGKPACGEYKEKDVTPLSDG